MSVVDKVINNDLLRLVTHKTGDSDSWWYVRIHPEKLEKYISAIESGLIGSNLIQYGDILFSGWGKEPPRHIQREVEGLVLQD